MNKGRSVSKILAKEDRGSDYSAGSSVQKVTGARRHD